MQDSNGGAIELAETDARTAKAALRAALKEGTVPGWTPELAGRWRAVKTRDRALEGDRLWFTQRVAEAIISSTVVGDQRDIFYGVRGRYGDKTIAFYDAKRKRDVQVPLKDEKVYDLFTGPIMENEQLLAGAPMQSMGVRAGPRGFLFSQDGSAYVPRKGIRYELDGSPVLYFDLADDDTRFESRCRKVVHFEKAAGFERLTSGNISLMLEAIFSTSQGQLTEAAHKFLAQREAEGRQIYAVHDSDPYGVQMQMLYGLASKNSAYMPSSFYAKSVVPLGLFPSIADAMGLPPEDIADNARRLAETNLTDMAAERPELGEDVQVFKDTGQQWEFQALNALGEMAPQVYIAEALRARGDEIKHVPPAEEVRAAIVETIRGEIEEYVKGEIESYARAWLRDNVQPELVKRLTEALAADVQAFEDSVPGALASLEGVSAGDLREAVKKKLVENPAQFADRAMGQVVSDMLTERFAITAEIGCVPEVLGASAEASLEVAEPDAPDGPLTKDDIVGAIEERMVRDGAERAEIVGRIRPAVERRFGEPSQDW